MNVAVIDLVEAQVTVALFKEGVVSRVRVDQNALHQFRGVCANELLPLTFHQHEKALELLPRGQLNKERVCEIPSTGGHHDPGLACGPTGGSRCNGLDLPGSS